jgi:hypothetical protein
MFGGKLRRSVDDAKNHAGIVVAIVASLVVALTALILAVLK